MENYQPKIGIKTLYLCFRRRLLVFLFSFLTLLCCSILISQIFIPKTYQSEANIVNGDAIIGTVQYEHICFFIKDNKIAEETSALLESKSIRHRGGSLVSSNEIYKGISFSKLSSNTTNIYIYYQSSDSSITKAVLENVLEIAIPLIRETPSYSKIYVHSEVSNPVNNSKNNTYLIVGIAASIIISFILTLSIEVVKDEVYDIKDFEHFEGKGFELVLTGKSNNEK